MTSSKVVYLGYDNPRARRGGMELLACLWCKNKTYVLIVTENFPMVRCAACGNNIGSAGWVDEPDPNAPSRDRWQVPD
jgi:hypothetical protein